MKKILIIEDEEMIRETTCEFLTMNSYDVTCAKDGIEGIKKAVEIVPDLIICDIMMPFLDGYQVLSFLRQSSEIRNIPFIFLSARAEKNDLRAGMNLGADDYMTKPFKFSELLAAIETRLKRKEQISRELNEKLDSIVETLNSTTTHEYNTSLNGILGFSNLLIDDFDNFNKEEMLKILITVKNSGERLHKITRNILLYAHIQRFEVKNVTYPTTEYPVDSLSLIDKVKTIASSYERLSDLKLSLDKYILTIAEADINLIIGELVDNAFKFSEPKTIVDIRGEKTDQQYCITIQDKGRGISKRNISEIGAFVQFEREKQAQQGMGLGLYLSKCLITLNRGTFDIQSNLNEGTTVIFCLPMSK